MCLIPNIPHYKKCVFNYTVPVLEKQSSKVLEHTLMPKSLTNLESDGWMIEIAVMNMVCLLTSVIYGRVATLTLTYSGKKKIYGSPLTYILTYAINTLTLTSFCPVTHYYSLHPLDRRDPGGLHLNLYPATKPCGAASTVSIHPMDHGDPGTSIWICTLSPSLVRQPRPSPSTPWTTEIQGAWVIQRMPTQSGPHGECNQPLPTALQEGGWISNQLILHYLKQ